MIIIIDCNIIHYTHTRAREMSVTLALQNNYAIDKDFFFLLIFLNGIISDLKQGLKSTVFILIIGHLKFRLTGYF